MITVATKARRHTAAAPAPGSFSGPECWSVVCAIVGAEDDTATEVASFTSEDAAAAFAAAKQRALNKRQRPGRPVFTAIHTPRGPRIMDGDHTARRMIFTAGGGRPVTVPRGTPVSAAELDPGMFRLMAVVDGSACVLSSVALEDFHPSARTLQDRLERLERAAGQLAAGSVTDPETAAVLARVLADVDRQRTETAAMLAAL